MAESRGWANFVVALGYPDLRTYLIGRFFYRGATWLYKIAVAWAVWELTHSATWLGIFGILDQAPSLLVQPWGGVIADRMDRLQMMRITQALLLTQSVVLGVIVEFGLVNIWNLALFTFMFGAINGLQQPANQTIVPTLVERKDMPIAISLNSLTFNAAAFIGPMVGGYVIGAWGVGVAILCNAIGAVIFMVCLMFMSGTYDTRRADKPRSSAIAEISEGVAYVVRHKGIGPLTVNQGLLALVAFSLERLLPMFADGVFEAGATGLAWMTAALGCGAIASSVLLARRAGVGGLTIFVSRLTLILGAFYIVLALSPSIWMASAAVFVVGAAIMGVQAGAQTLVQYALPGDMRGRVISLFGLVNNVCPSIGAFAIGVAADHVGVPAAVVGVGILVLLAGVWATRRAKMLAAALEAEPR